MKNTPEKTSGSNASSPAPKGGVHGAPVRRSGRRCVRRGVYFRGFVWEYLRRFVERSGLSVSAVVGKALERFLGEGLRGGELERFRLLQRESELLAEERSLRERLRVILRSGAYLQDYARKLLLGSEKELGRVQRRVGVYASIDTEELDVILRLLQRRKQVAKELIQVEAKLLPKERYPLALTDKGWKIGSRSRAREHKSVKRNVRTQKKEKMQHGKSS